MATTQNSLIPTVKETEKQETTISTTTRKSKKRNNEQTKALNFSTKSEAKKEKSKGKKQETEKYRNVQIILLPEESLSIRNWNLHKLIKFKFSEKDSEAWSWI